MNADLQHIDLALVRHVLSRPVGGSGVASVDVLLAEVVARDGSVGLGFSYALGSSALPAFHSAAELAQALMDSAARGAPFEQWAMLERTFNRTGKGPNYLALAAIDVASWDLEAKLSGIPLWRCFGAERPCVRLYQSAGFGAGDTVEQTCRLLEQAAGDGYGAAKLRVSGVPADIARVEAAARWAERRGMRLMLDVNEKGDASEFAEFARGVHSLPLEWIEEPHSTGDWRRYRDLLANWPLRLAAGEHMQGLSDALVYLDERMLVAIQPDLAMMGGLSESIRVSRHARSCGVMVAPHFLPGLFVHVAGATGGMDWLEEFPLVEPLLEGWPTPTQDRRLSPGDAPGHGLRMSSLARNTAPLRSVRVTAMQRHAVTLEK